MSVTANVTLTRDLVCPPATDGLDVEVGPVTINLNGHSIIGAGGDEGVFACCGPNITIENGTIKGFGVGVTGNAASTLSLKNLRLAKNSAGVAMDFGTSALITGSVINENRTDGVFLNGPVTSVDIESTQINRNGGDGFFADTTAGATFANDTISFNGGYGITLFDTGSRMTGNVVSGNGKDGILIDDILPVPGIDVLSQNHADGNGGHGIIVGIPEVALPAADGGGNTAKSNALSPQCIGIRC
jgi:hypothetical protein